MKAATIIPTYNERANITRLIPEILEVFREEAIDGEIIIVDDASPDGTGELAEELAQKLNRIFVLRRSRKMGLGSAYKDGFRYALSKGVDSIIEMDADLSHDPTYLPAFIAKLGEGYDLVIGSRYIPGGVIPKWTFLRRIVSSVANQSTRFFLGLTVKDITSGYRAYSSNALKTVNFQMVMSEGYAFQVEMVMRCQRAGLKICEIPIAFMDREKGESKLSKGEMWRFLIAVIKLIFLEDPKNQPVS